MFSCRGSSLAMWVVILGVVISANLMFMVPVKRAITKKAIRLTDHMVWGEHDGPWGDPVDEDGGADSNQIDPSIYSSTADNTIRRTEQAGKPTVKTTQNMRMEMTSYYHGYQ